MDTITNYIKTIMHHLPARKAQAISILMDAGHNETEAELIENNAFRACYASAIAVTKVLDEMPTDEAVQASALIHICMSVARDMSEMAARFSEITIGVSMGMNADDITRGKTNCDCDTCKATRALVSQLQQQIIGGSHG